MRMPFVVPFPGADAPTPEMVGGKGASLIRLVEAGVPVPAGAVLTTAFFAPWFDEVRRSQAWARLAAATPRQWPPLCAELQELSRDLALSRSQEGALVELETILGAAGDGALLAVRSSSPEEDLDTASFAGGYATRLGVRRADLAEAVRHCFASSLDARVLAYKRQHGLDVLAPRIAVVVQQQIDSEVAGVGFSLNPLTNDYDEAVIDSSWGLGESVVGGLVTPDHFVVDKVERRVIERAVGAKRTSIRLGPDGGTVERPSERAGEPSLDDARIAELTEMICRIEALYGQPVDVEWAYAAGRLHVLQARPVTTYVPLPPEMVTRPGERRRLYTDLALSSGLTINAPISPMGLAWMEECITVLARLFFGVPARRPGIEDGVWFCAGGRMYQNLSNVLWLASPKLLAKGSTTSDALMAEILADVDGKRYRSALRPPWARLGMLMRVPRLMWRMRGFFGRTAWAVLAPERARRAYQREADAFLATFTAPLDPDLTLDEFRRKHTDAVMRYLFRVTMSALAAGLAGLGAVDRVVRRKSVEDRALAERLKLGFTGNVVAEMGIALHRLARLLDRSDLDDVPRLLERLEQRRLPSAFLGAWDDFIATYGWRGPHEMDLASPRYADDPGLALRQVAAMAVDDEGFDPAAAHARLVEQRRRAFETLLARTRWPRRALLRRVHRLIELFAGTRDTPKHHNLLFASAIRARIGAEGRRLVREGRLDAAADVFDLTFDDLGAARRDPALDVRAACEERTRFTRRLAARVRTFPAVIDSRGRILRPPPRAERQGELSGMPVSPGVATGPVKVLHDPHEKPVEKGDILVAYTTDPGWTPLFVNAAAVVLEVGGVLQHGAVVAREYGKPCVAGIDRLLTRLRDGQIVEVDGTAGVVRIRDRAAALEHEPSSPAPASAGRCGSREPAR